MWDARFSTDEYVYGTAPSGFLRAQAAYLTPGQRALAIADGEGRNSVFMAEQGMDVTAMDGSAVALEKARKLADARGVSVRFLHGDITAWDWRSDRYDLVAGIFFQFLPPAARAQVFDGLKASLNPGGLLMIHGYREEQVAYGTGGPGLAENMYSEALLRDSFAGFEVERLASYDAELQEGTGHRGRSALIDFVARKPG